MVAWLIGHRARILVAIALGAIVAGGAFHLLGGPAVGDAIWTTVLVLLTAVLAFGVAKTVLIRHHMASTRSRWWRRPGLSRSENCWPGSSSGLTADAVITVDRVDRVADAVHAGRGALRIARQCVVVGTGLSLPAIGVAAFGYLPPLAGACCRRGSTSR